MVGVSCRSKPTTHSSTEVLRSDGSSAAGWMRKKSWTKPGSQQGEARLAGSPQLSAASGNQK